MNIYKNYITELKSDEVFVFGSNLDGFHGAGSAGYATFNESGNVWRKYNYDKLPDGTKGKWNVKGKGKGPQVGEIGKSYALPTVTRAGQKKSLSPEQIKNYIKELYDFINSRLHLKFYIAQDVKVGLNGYSSQEMADMFGSFVIPDNAYFKEEFADLIGKETKVVNKRFDSYDEYIGRGSIYGNIYTHIKDRQTKAEFIVESLEESIDKYKIYFIDRVEKDIEFRKKVLGLRGKSLGCFCKQRNREVPCHGDVIVDWLNDNNV